MKKGNGEPPTPVVAADSETPQVNVHQAKTHLSRLLQQVEKGREIVIARAGKPVAKLVPLVPPSRTRVLGGDEGRVWIAPDFDAPLPDDVVDDFYR